MISRQSILVVVRLLLLAVCAAALCLLARGAGVPSSVADYIFTVPRLTNHIRGVVITSTNAYRVIRSEDVDWLREAFAERWSIRAGRVPSSPWAGVGARMGDGDKEETGAFWNGLPRGSDEGWLDPYTQLHTGSRVYDYGEKVTNTYVVVAYTNAATNALSTIEMPRTNGSVCVYTNLYRVEWMAPYNQVVTNVHAMTPLDYCRAGDGVFGGYTNTPVHEFGYPSDYGMRTPSIGEFTNAWAALRGTKRLADVNYYATNLPVRIDEYANNYDPDAPPYHGTNDVVFTQYGYELMSGCETNGYWNTRAIYNPEYTACIPTRFYSSLVSAGGANRVSTEAAFAHFHFSYFFHDVRNPDSDRSVHKDAVVRLPSPTLDISGTNALAVVRVDPKALCSAAATAAGCPAVPSAGVMYSAPNGEYHHWQTESHEFIIIYSITPSVKLPDW